MFTILYHPLDLEWLETHACPAAKGQGLRFAILYGNEDSPSKIEAWCVRNPCVTQPPDFLWHADTQASCTSTIQSVH